MSCVGSREYPLCCMLTIRSFLAESEEMLRTGLRILKEWCNKWSVKINAEKWGILHAYEEELRG